MLVNNPSKAATVRILLRNGDPLTVVTSTHLALEFLNSMGDKERECISLAHGAGVLNFRRVDVLAANIATSSQFIAEELADLI